MEIKDSFIKDNFGEVEWECSSVETTTDSVKINNKDLDTPTSSNITGLIVRMILPDKRVGISFSTNPVDYKNTFLKAYKIAKVSKPFKNCPKVSNKNTFSKNFSNFNDYSENEIFDTIKNINSTLDNKAPLIRSEVFKTLNKCFYNNSNGSNINLISDSVSYVLGIGKGDRIGYASTVGRKKLPSVNCLVSEALDYYNWSKKKVKVSSGDYSVLFANDAFNTVLQPIVSSVLGNNVVEKSSNFINNLGEQVLSDKITIEDNPNHEFNTSYFDFEGNKVNKTIVVKNGVLKTFLHDTYTSKELDSLNTFNSSSMVSKPSVAFHNLEIKGDDKLISMIKSVKKGFIFYDLYPEHVVNEITGSFGLNSSTFYYIEKGEIKGIVKGGVVTGNSFEIFKNVESISKESRYDLDNYDLPVVKTTAHIIA